MNLNQHNALVDMLEAVVKVGHIDAEMRLRAKLLLFRLGMMRFDMIRFAR